MSKPNFFNTDIDYQVRANYSIGGSAPMGMPREIRKIESYNPTLALGLEANATKWVSEDRKWGIRVGVRVEGKGMKTKAEVKNYLTEIKQDNSKVRGYYTGKVQTTVKKLLHYSTCFCCIPFVRQMESLWWALFLRTY